MANPPIFFMVILRTNLTSRRLVTSTHLFGQEFQTPYEMTRVALILCLSKPP